MIFHNLNIEDLVVLFCCRDIVALSKSTVKITISVEFICLQMLRRPPIPYPYVSRKVPGFFLEQTIKHDIEEPGEQM